MHSKSVIRTLMMQQRGRQTRVMGIINVTPDSFSDGGRFYKAEDAIHHAYQLIEEGADILDIGAESTRPTAHRVSLDEEWRRLEPVLSELCSHSSVPISVDTYKAGIAERALELGASIINDVWGGLADDRMFDVVAAADCDYIWMHNRREAAAAKPFETLMEDTKAGLRECLARGIAKEHICIDPGIGFAKSYQDNLIILKRLAEYCQLGYPVLLGTSRKSVIGITLNVPASERLAGSLATAALGIQAGISAIRVHDVAATVQACKMADAIVGAHE